MKRRTFLRTTAPLLAAPIALGRGFEVLARGLGSEQILRRGDRILVVIQLDGGNDGLNTVVPVEDDLYYDARPTLAIPKNEGLALERTDGLRLHPSLVAFQRMYGEGTLAIVENVGYERMNLSHFTGTEIWNTASGTSRDAYLTTGWLGRLLAGEFPEYPDELPPDPPAIEISPSTSSLFGVSGTSIAMSVTDPEEIHRLVSSSEALDDEPTRGGRSGAEWSYIASIDGQSRRYAAAVRSAYERAGAMAQYPDEPLAAALAIVARLIAGGLSTSLYKVRLGGFDTHSAQAAVHADLLKRLSDAVDAFERDLRGHGILDRVVGMTYSEFGRRVRQNGSGTDHGTAAPHFVFGGSVRGGVVHGGAPRLDQVDEHGNLPFGIDFRCYFASILGPMFGLDDTRLLEVFPTGGCRASGPLSLFHAGSVPSRLSAPALRIAVSPNPADRQVVVVVDHGMGDCTATLHDVAGAVVLLAVLSGPSSRRSLDVSSLPAGRYELTVSEGARSASLPLLIRR
jgi:uncharacterized protein (DUF1501 family)